MIEEPETESNLCEVTVPIDDYVLIVFTSLTIQTSKIYCFSIRIRKAVVVGCYCLRKAVLPNSNTQLPAF